VQLALQQPDAFDVVGGLGGYMEVGYVMRSALRLQLAGFCPLASLESSVDTLNAPDESGLDCGPGDTLFPLEIPQDFNHLAFSKNGATFDRDFYGSVFQSMTMAFGNFTGVSTGNSPYLPTGVDESWWFDTAAEARCESPPAIAPGHSYNLEYNPAGTYPVIPFCDSKHHALNGLGGADYDPTVGADTPMDIVLAVDINANGIRDYAEPLFLNGRERFTDTGADGCWSLREDGLGGCLESDAPDSTLDDPNGDDFHWWSAPHGTEGNDRFDAAEMYADDGLDGVAGTADYGEANGVFDVSPAMARGDALSGTNLLAQVDDEQLKGMQFYLDAGIRDPLHAGVATRHLVGALQARTGNVQRYDGFTDGTQPLFPGITANGLVEAIFDEDLSADALGQHLYVEYGDPDASEAEILAGDGGHVGDVTLAINRILTFLVLASFRFEDPDVDVLETTSLAMGQYHHFYSEGLQARRGYTVALPPGYDDSDRSHLRYPVLYFLHGLGQTAQDLMPVALITSTLMEEGRMPKVILVFPDGACCDRDKENGERHCACANEEDGQRVCVTPSCKGPETDCETSILPADRLHQECHGGSLYYDLVSDKWGAAREDLNYGASVFDLIEHVDATYRTRGSEEGGTR